jgi:adenylate cyclase
VAAMGGSSGDWSAARLASETETSPERVRRLVAAGVLAPDGPDGFRAGDVQRVLVANAMEDAGLTLEQLRRGIELGLVSFDDTDELYPAPGPLARGSVATLAAELNLSSDALLRVVTAFGLPRPDPDAHLHEADETNLRAFVEAWRPLGDDDLLVRAARAYGDAVRRAAEGWIGIFEESAVDPLADRAIPWEEMRRRVAEPGLRILAVSRSMSPWLLDQHLVQQLNRLNFDSIERLLALAGAGEPAPRSTAAIVFADLSGYTRLTEDLGDEAAAASATRLAAVADEIALQHGGRLVKLLGDGVMLHFPRPSDALAAAIALRDAMQEVGLPPAHMGIHAGGVIRRESDFFGRTVNIASRLAMAAGPGEILVTDELVTAARDGDGAVPELTRLETPLRLKGIDGAVAAHRVGPPQG